VYQGKLDADQFFHGYRRYAEAVQHHFVRYEDFTADPSDTLQRICAMLEISFDQTCLERWHLNDHITGDNKKSSRGTTGEEASTIRPLPRRQVDRELEDAINANSDYRQILELLGYQTESPASV
ncbi:MAG: sulfotransferase domain-containing protein, partial [Gammaproteobacteria bacterium]